MRQTKLYSNKYLFWLLYINLILTALGSPSAIFRPSLAQATLLSGSVFNSVDYGFEWTPDSNGLSDTRVNALEIDPKTPTTLYAATRRGVFKTTDAGSHWQSTGSFVSLYVIKTIAVDPVTPAKVYAAAFGVGGTFLFKSTDAGSTWRAINLSPSTANFIAPASLQINPQDPNVLYFRNDLQLYKSVDGGEHWNAVLTIVGSDFNTPADYKIDPRNPATIYMIGAHQLFKTTDGGSTWADLGELLYTLGVRPWGVTINPVNSSEVYVVTDAAKAVRSTDGGDSWAIFETQTPIPLYNLTIDPTGSVFYTTVMADRRRTLYKSLDKGSSWFVTGLSSAQTFTNLAEKYDLEFHPQNPVIMYAATNGDELTPTASPWLRSFTIEGKRLLVFGERFDAGAVILLDGEEQPTKNDGVTPTGKLIGKTAGKRLRKNPALKIQVRNANGQLTQEVTLWPPLN
jgi:photosystem II stability/assembly factor-like uncharacterized protein